MFMAFEVLVTPASSLVLTWARFCTNVTRRIWTKLIQDQSDLSSLFSPRATQARLEAAGEGAAARQVEADPGTRTTRSPPSPHPTTPSPHLFTWWSTTPRATSATRCHTTGSSTRTRTRSCPRSWCPTCWRRRATSCPTRCPRWVDTSRSAFVTSKLAARKRRPTAEGRHSFQEETACNCLFVALSALTHGQRACG